MSLSSASPSPDAAPPGACDCRIFGIKNCDTMKKAFAWLDANDVAYEFVDYKKTGVAAAQLPGWVRRAGWGKLLNTRGMMWRKLSETERSDVDEQKALALMATYPSLIKRPVVVLGGGEVLVGFDVAEWERIFSK